MRKKKMKAGDWLPLIPIGLVVLMVVALVVWRSVDTDEPHHEQETLDTGQTSSTVTNNPNSGGDEPVPQPDNEAEIIKLRQPPEDVKISCDEVAVYNGEFVESGKDEPVTNVASMLVTNKSDKYLDYAKLIYEVDGNEAIFILSGLQPGKSAWVLESKGLKATAESKFVYVNAITAYKDHVVRAPKELDIKYGAGMLMVKNVSDEPLENVVVYYKVVHKDGNYLGGRTYAVSFGSIEPGQSVQKDAGHYKEDWTQIVRVDLTKPTDDNE